jgi:hypothetical protein
MFKIIRIKRSMILEAGMPEVATCVAGEARDVEREQAAWHLPASLALCNLAPEANPYYRMLTSYPWTTAHLLTPGSSRSRQQHQPLMKIPRLPKLLLTKDPGNQLDAAVEPFSGLKRALKWSAEERNISAMIFRDLIHFH